MPGPDEYADECYQTFEKEIMPTLQYLLADRSRGNTSRLIL